MVRKTVSIDEGLYAAIEEQGVMDSFRNFSELVSVSLRQTLEQMKRDRYRRQISQMANDPMVLEDIAMVEEEFRYADGEIDAF